MIKELGEAINLKFLKNKYIGTLFAIIPAMLLLIIPINGISLGKFLWPLFGASNQMLAALTLMIIAFYFQTKGKKILLIVIPMIFISLICIISFISNFYNTAMNHPVLLAVNSILLFLIIWLLLEGILHYKKTNKK